MSESKVNSPNDKDEVFLNSKESSDGAKAKANKPTKKNKVAKRGVKKKKGKKNKDEHSEDNEQKPKKKQTPKAKRKEIKAKKDKKPKKDKTKKAKVRKSPREIRLSYDKCLNLIICDAEKIGGVMKDKQILNFICSENTETLKEHLFDLTKDFLNSYKIFRNSRIELESKMK
ncbi:MAG: hypothetical protein MJ252_06600, partial [archaeon]|nr:hypothetical protein [archaeon]